MVHPWYMWIYGSKETAIEEKPQILRMHRDQYCTIEA
jgi:hypothetical protein